jgi:predicted Zn finger-like uncharacterized protein
MTSTISCPSCQRTLRVPESLLGQAVKCPGCSHTFTAPESIEEEAPRRVAATAPERPSRRPAAPPPEDELDEEPRPSKRRPRDDDHEDDYDDAPRRRSSEKPGKVQAISVMTLVGGILATLAAVILMVTIYGLCWPGTYYSLVLGIMAIVKGSQLLGERASEQTPPSGIAIMQIINIINCDWANLTMGIISLVFLGDPEVKRFFRRR